MDLMQLRRNLLMIQVPVPNGLPVEYLRVNYLQSTGAQYIDTQYHPTSSTSAQLEYSLTETASGHIGFFGQWSGRIKAEIRYATRWYTSSPTRNANYPSAIDGEGVSANVDYTLILNENGTTINNINAPGSRNASTNENNIYLFALNDSGTAVEIPSIVKCKSFKLFENGVLSYDLVPCVRVSDSKPGFYDLVGRQFYTNAGTGEFDYLYSIGTNVYDGLSFQKNVIVDRATGEVTSGDMAVSDFIQVSEAFEYTRSYRLYYVYNYDAQKNYLGYQSGVNDLNTSVINSFIQGTKFIRTMVHPNYISSNGLIGQTNCKLIRTA